MVQGNTARIEKAWEESKGWITEFDGLPKLALLLGVSRERISAGFEQLAETVENLRVTLIEKEKMDSPQFISLGELPSALDKLQAGQVIELSVNYATRQEAFELDVHAVLHHLEGPNFGIELVWWSDQVFSEETDNPAQFQALASYFLYLQELFAAQNLVLSPESGRIANQEEEEWVEI